jgi:hypothetical protein
MDKKQIIIDALNKLAIALADHKHQWTNEERRLYERALKLLNS